MLVGLTIGKQASAGEDALATLQTFCWVCCQRCKFLVYSYVKNA